MSDLDEIARTVNPHGEQALHGTQLWALQVATYYKTLRASGAGIEVAAALTRDWQAINLHHSSEQSR